MKVYDRYYKFRKDGAIEVVPFCKIPVKSTDVYEYYHINKTRLDLLSYKYYNDCSYDWLIMQANPEYGSMEFEIPDGSKIRIPYPLNDSITDYNNEIETYNKLYKN